MVFGCFWHFLDVFFFLFGRLGHGFHTLLLVFGFLYDVLAERGSWHHRLGSLLFLGDSAASTEKVPHFASRGASWMSKTRSTKTMAN